MGICFLLNRALAVIHLCLPLADGTFMRTVSVASNLMFLLPFSSSLPTEKSCGFFNFKYG